VTASLTDPSVHVDALGSDSVCADAYSLFGLPGTLNSATYASPAGNATRVHSLSPAQSRFTGMTEIAPAEKLAAETSKRFPSGTIWNAIQLPEIRAAIALHRDQPAASVELLASASPYERAYLGPVYLRGLAYLRLQKGAEAAAEFRKIVDHKGINWGATWIHPYWGQFYSLSYLGMARSMALVGDTAKARKAFQDFFELWKDQSEIPKLIIFERRRRLGERCEGNTAQSTSRVFAIH
jgi:hypothetical protein